LFPLSPSEAAAPILIVRIAGFVDQRFDDMRPDEQRQTKRISRGNKKAFAKFLFWRR
jgi:hypothetical protein